MEIYRNNSQWKIMLTIMGTVIVAITMVYSQYLARNLAKSELEMVKLYADALISVSNNTGESTIFESLILERLLGNIPVIMEGDDGVFQGNNYGVDKDADQEFLALRKEKIQKKGYEPIEGPPGYAKWIYYENSTTYQLISLFPLAQILLLLAFMAFGYYVFSTSRRAEQNRVWAGMAKETAHQLGTPISAIIGWIEHLKDISENNPEQIEVVQELRKDVNRLELIADRFSKIGSKPDLEKTNLVNELGKCVRYMQRRASQKIRFLYTEENRNPVYANINSHLFDWVIENILRNALDAMESEGEIKADITVEGKMVNIDLSDSGKGIPAADHKNIFKPGFTTKKRGWGLGLSLAKRIIENYHSGKIFVKSSKPNEGTTFTIQIPLA
ncbi:MAG: HAMP domain-containing histidine kinase [Saprospiraceae bacterium]|nr:HAMP domain-containing histidine kinase [Bacteroidia bacterium]MBT8230657.1 HAMP domain-containing histidine kinase [Bacteroidia bacterium]NNF23052.1 HAMP domain-containing histidine kinase [Saprospiraceae bacterium]